MLHALYSARRVAKQVDNATELFVAMAVLARDVRGMSLSAQLRVSWELVGRRLMRREQGVSVLGAQDIDEFVYEVDRAGERLRGVNLLVRRGNMVVKQYVVIPEKVIACS